MSPALWLLASTLLKLWCALTRPTALRCPPQMWLSTGVRGEGWLP